MSNSSTKGSVSQSSTRALSGSARDYKIRRCRLVVTQGRNVGLSRAAEGPEFTIGTDSGNDLVLTDPTVSSHHCTILATPRGFVLRDLDSTNGTTLASCPIESALLKPGVSIGVGETLLLFESLDEEIREPLSEEERCGPMLGCSPAIRRIFALVPRLAASDSTLLIEGETGTGKGLLAEAIHQASPRAAQPFVVLDCSAIPPTLIESELFGHTKGAFTGAHVARAGAFEAAFGGTVFLDEIGELPVEMQPKLLRALEDRVVKRVGSVDPIRLDVRVIAATNRELRQEVNRGNFRADLFHRLNVLRVRIPPLRERREDIQLLTTHFYEAFAGQGEGGAPAELLVALARQDWKGNVRELRNAVERAVVVGDPALWQEPGEEAAAGAESASNGAFEPFDSTLSYRAAKERVVARWERWYIRELLERNSGSQRKAARAARMDRNYLRELLRRHRLDGDDA